MLASASAHPVHEQSTLAETIHSTLTSAAAALRVRLTVLSRIDGSTSTIVAVHDTFEQLRPGTMFPLIDSFCLQLLPTGKPLAVSDISRAMPSLQRIPESLELNINAYLGVPLILESGLIFGTFWVADSMAHSFSTKDVQILVTLARLLQHELAHDAAQRQVERQTDLSHLHAPIDLATGLMGHEAFLQQLVDEERRRRRYGKHYTLVLIEMKDVPTPSLTRRCTQRLALQAGLAGILMFTTRITDCSAHLSEYSFGILVPHLLQAEVAPWQVRFEEAIHTWNLIHRAIQPQLVVSLATADSTEARGTELLNFAKERLHA